MRRILHLLLWLGLAFSPPGLAQTDAPALWKIGGPKGSVYLFGSFHMLPPDVKWRTPALQKALIFISRSQNLESDKNDTAFAAKINDGGFYYTPAGTAGYWRRISASCASSQA